MYLLHKEIINYILQYVYIYDMIVWQNFKQIKMNSFLEKNSGNI